MPKEATDEELTYLRRSPRRKPIKRLMEGEIFGEIGALTNLKRTCSAITKNTCVMFTLEKSNLQKVAEKSPMIYNRIYKNMDNYDDEDMTQR